MTTYNRIVFNDGEGLRHDDLNNAQASLANEITEAISEVSGAQIGNAHDLAYAASTGMDAFNEGGQLRGNNLHASRIYAPSVMGGIIIPNSGTAPTTLSLGKGTLVQRSTASTPGTIPEGYPSIDTPLVHSMSANVRNLVSDLTGNAAPGAGNPRWDTWGVALNYTTATAARDFQDAISGALSSSAADKEASVGIAAAFVTGAQSATFDMATMAAGYVPILTKRRAVGEASPYTPTDFYYHAYPMRYAVETIYPHEALIVGTTYLDNGTNGWLMSPSGDTFSYKGTPGSATAYFFSRKMHAGCRLVGVSFVTPAATLCINDINLTRVTYGVDGTQSTSTLVNIAAFHARIATATSSGYRGMGEQDWSPSASKPLPIWGNGRYHGPLFSGHRMDLSTDAVSPYDHGTLDLLAVTVGLTTTNYKVGPIRLHYLY